MGVRPVGRSRSCAFARLHSRPDGFMMSVVERDGVRRGMMLDVLHAYFTSMNALLPLWFNRVTHGRALAYLFTLPSFYKSQITMPPEVHPPMATMMIITCTPPMDVGLSIHAMNPRLFSLPRRWRSDILSSLYVFLSYSGSLVG